MLEHTHHYKNIFLSHVPLIDVRAPIEFAQGAFPGAINLPILNDVERAEVGTCYKNLGQTAAIELGHRLVSGECRVQRINAWMAAIQANTNAQIYCFRGGMRSGIAQQWLQEAGCSVSRIVGGYKAMRQFLLQSLPVSISQGPLWVLSGKTGCAKTQLLNTLNHAIDLEGLANHRGSAFGKRVHGQPSQIDFENALSIAFLQQRNISALQAIVVEDESHLIGRNVLPEELLRAMQSAPLVMLEANLEQRVEHTYQIYILHKLQEWQNYLGAENGFNAFADELLLSLDSLKRRLGGWRYQQIHVQMKNALTQHARGNSEVHCDWIRSLLIEYYDPMYDYQLQKKTSRILFSGNYQDVAIFLQQNIKPMLEMK